MAIKSDKRSMEDAFICVAFAEAGELYKLHPVHLKKLTDMFADVAFAEAGELHQVQPHHLRKLNDVFAEIAFAEAGEPYPGDEDEEPKGPVCVKGETGGGFCV